jgi:hypothetical protein
MNSFFIISDILYAGVRVTFQSELVGFRYPSSSGPKTNCALILDSLAHYSYIHRQVQKFLTWKLRACTSQFTCAAPLDTWYGPINLISFNDARRKRGRSVALQSSKSRAKLRFILAVPKAPTNPKLGEAPLLFRSLQPKLALTCGFLSRIARFVRHSHDIECCGIFCGDGLLDAPYKYMEGLFILQALVSTHTRAK